MPSTEPEHVILRSGWSVPLPALQLLWDLEARGFTVALAAGTLRVSPRSQLTADDDASIRRHRDALFALVDGSSGVM